MKKRTMMIVLGMFAFALIPTQQLLAAPAPTSAGGKIGELKCHTIPGTGTNLLLHSTVDVKCTFASSAGETEHYKGETGIGLGIDLHINHEAQFAYVVMGADFKKGTYKMAGKYGGAGASFSLGRGVGGGALIGGSSDSFSLTPIGISATKGWGVQGGLTYLFLEPDKAADR